MVSQTIDVYTSLMCCTQKPSHAQHCQGRTSTRYTREQPHNKSNSSTTKRTSASTPGHPLQGATANKTFSKRPELTHMQAVSHTLTKLNSVSAIRPCKVWQPAHTTKVTLNTCRTTVTPVWSMCMWPDWLDLVSPRFCHHVLQQMEP